MDESEQQPKTKNEKNPDSQRLKKLKLVCYAEQAERYEDMVDRMKQVIAMGGSLDQEERNLFSVAYKNIVGARRLGWRSVKAFPASNEKELAKRKDYMATIQDELENCCKEVVELIDNSLLKTAEDDESKIFYLKMKGDYNRYITEVVEEDYRNESIEKSREAYNNAYDLCQKTLTSDNPTRLGVALNFSVFHYEVAGDPKSAIALAKAAFDDAVTRIDNSPNFKDCALIMQLLRDNLTVWISEEEEEKKEEE